jgi:hypothetical protein
MIENEEVVSGMDDREVLRVLAHNDEPIIERPLRDRRPERNHGAARVGRLAPPGKGLDPELIIEPWLWDPSPFDRAHLGDNRLAGCWAHDPTDDPLVTKLGDRGIEAFVI